MKKLSDSLAGWKPLAYSAMTLLAVLLAGCVQPRALRPGPAPPPSPAEPMQPRHGRVRLHHGLLECLGDDGILVGHDGIFDRLSRLDRGDVGGVGDDVLGLVQGHGDLSRESLISSGG